MIQVDKILTPVELRPAIEARITLYRILINYPIVLDSLEVYDKHC